MNFKLSDRYNVLSMIFIIVFAVITFQLAYLQVIKGKDYDEQSQRRLLKEREIKAPRGNIMDRYGTPIAVNRLGFTVHLAQTRIDVKDLNEMLLKMVKIFEKNNDAYYRSLNKYLTINPSAFGSMLSDSDGKPSDSKIEKWKVDMGVKEKDLDTVKSPEDAFKFLRTKFKIADSYTDEDAYKIMTLKYEILIRGYSNLNPILLAKDTTKETVAEMEERHDEFPGVSTNIEPMRRYIDAQNLAHVIGYIRGIDQDEYKKLKPKGYEMDDTIGKAGIELTLEDELRGTNGQKRVEEDIFGKKTEDLGENIAAIPGNDVVLTIDTKLQDTAMKSLENNINEIKKSADYKDNYGDANAGAAVAIDVNSGEVLAMASYPSYDPSVYLAGADNKDAQTAISAMINDNKNKPMLNRTIQEIYAPGSTYKPVTAIAALEEGIITAQEKILDEGVLDISGQKFTCLEFRKYGMAHGYINLKTALETSCNIYFHKIGIQTGIDNLSKWAGMFGLGQKTGVELSYEAGGILASKEYKKKVWNDDWRPADTAQAAIGQIYNAFTPIQLADYVSTIANGGKRYKPFLVKRVVQSDGTVVKETEPQYEQVPLKTETISAIKEGMIAVAEGEDGTAATVFREFKNLTGIEVAAKTGTPETGREANHSSNAVFICYAPADNPKIAVAIVIERGVWGSNAAPVARDILAEYFNKGKTSNADDKIKPDEVTLTR